MGLSKIVGDPPATVLRQIKALEGRVKVLEGFLGAALEGRPQEAAILAILDRVQALEALVGVNEQ